MLILNDVSAFFKTDILSFSDVTNPFSKRKDLNFLGSITEISSNLHLLSRSFDNPRTILKLLKSSNSSRVSFNSKYLFPMWFSNTFIILSAKCLSFSKSAYLGYMLGLRFFVTKRSLESMYTPTPNS